MKKKIIIYGGSSNIARELIKFLKKDNVYFIIFCRKKDQVLEFFQDEKIDNESFEIFEVDLLNLSSNIDVVRKMKNDIEGLVWIAGSSGDPILEFNNDKECENNIKINFLHPIIIINKIISKLDVNKKTFVSVLTSVAGLRGRSKRLFYCSAKAGMISYLSGLRQKLSKTNTRVITIIPGYMSTKPFNINSPKFLITSPQKAAKIIYKSIYSNKEIVYISNVWRFIMYFINLIPEKIFKNLKF